ncbi:hypothetical protein D3C81_2045060 [compost metagenome]
MVLFVFAASCAAAKSAFAASSAVCAFVTSALRAAKVSAPAVSNVSAAVPLLLLSRLDNAVSRAFWAAVAAAAAFT